MNIQSSPHSKVESMDYQVGANGELEGSPDSYPKGVVLMSTRLLLAGGFALSTLFASTASAEATHVSAPAPDGEWVHTGVMVQVNQKLTIVASGKVGWDEIGIVATPNGVTISNPGCAAWTFFSPYYWPAPDLPCGALIGQIADGGPVMPIFKVGDYLSFVSPVAGELLLNINASSKSPNFTSWNITVYH